MSYGKRFTIKAAMEEIQQEETTVAAAVVAEDDVVVADAIEPEQLAETDMIVMSEASADIESGQEQTESVVNDADGLDAIADSMEASEQTGGMDENAAKVVEVAVESFYTRLSINKRALPALESFGATSTRTRSTKLAVESVRENVKKAWQAVIAMLAKIGEVIKKFFNAMFNSVAKLGERAKNLLTRIKDTKQEGVVSFEMSEEDFEKHKHLFEAFNSDKNVDLEFIYENLVAAGKAIDSASEATQATATAVQSSVALKQMAEETPDLAKAASVTEAYAKMPEAKEGDKPAEGMKVVNVGPAWNGIQLQVEVPATEAAGVEAIGADSKSKVRMYVEEKATKAKGSIKGTKDAIVKMLTQVVDTIAKLVKAKEVADASKKAYETVTTGAKLAGAKVVETASAALKALQRWASNVVSFITKPFILLGNYVVKFCKASVDLAEKLVNKVKGTKAAEPEATSAAA